MRGVQRRSCNWESQVEFEKLVTFCSPPQAKKNSFLHLKNIISFMKTDVFTIKIRKFSACGGLFFGQLYCAKHPCSLWEKVGLYVCSFVCLYGFPASFVGAEKTWAHVLLSTQSLKRGFLRNPSLNSLAGRILTFRDPLFEHFFELFAFVVIKTM